MPDGDDSLTVHDVRPEDRRTHELLERVLAELAAIRSNFEQERLPLSRLHLRTAIPLLAEINAAIGDVAWTASELISHAHADTQLRAAIVAGIGKIDGGATRRIGRLLARCEGIALPGFRVERVDEAGADCATWRVLRI